MDFESMIDRLKVVREELSKRQDAKLKEKWEKHGDYRQWRIGQIAKAVIREMEELEEAIAIKGIDAIEDEIIDVRNTVEFLFDLLVMTPLY